MTKWHALGVGFWTGLLSALGAAILREWDWALVAAAVAGLAALVSFLGPRFEFVEEEASPDDLGPNETAGARDPRRPSPRGGGGRVAGPREPKG